MSSTPALRSELGLRAECGSCFALCCVALAFEKSADFPERKAAGDPCRNLQSDFRCGTHTTLRATGWNGCTVYDCFGAGQKVSQLSFGGVSWREAPQTQREMFALLPVMRQLHELLWYLSDALGRVAPEQQTGEVPDAAALAVRIDLPADLRAAIARVDALSRTLPAELLALDVAQLRFEVNVLLLEVSDGVRARHPRPAKRPDYRGADLMGAKLRGADLRGASLRGAYVIAADLRGADLRDADMIGADLRDAQVADADLSTALFVAQTQLNAARGNAGTKIPPGLERPAHWANTGSSPNRRS